MEILKKLQELIPSRKFQYFRNSLSEPSYCFFNRYLEFEKYVNSKIYNNKDVYIRVFIDDLDRGINLFTIPAIGLLPTKYRDPRIVHYLDAKKFKEIADSMLKLNLDGELKDGKINIKFNKSVIKKIGDRLIIDVYVTKGFVEVDFTKEEKFSLLLHEIGHWTASNVKEISDSKLMGNISDVFSMASNLFTGLFFLAGSISLTNAYGDPLHPVEIIILKSIISIVGASTLFAILFYFLYLKAARRSEYDADAFVKKLGYHKEYIKVFNEFRAAEEDQLKELNILQKIEAFIASLFSVHPSDRKRIKKLEQESENLNLADKILIYQSQFR